MLFQPDLAREEPLLIGYGLESASYRCIRPEMGGETVRALHSARLGLSLCAEGTKLRVSDSATKQDYPLVEKIRRLFRAGAGAKRLAEQSAAMAVDAMWRAEEREASEVNARIRAEARIAKPSAWLDQAKQRD